ncbi:MAG: hypothetical protein ACRD0O_12985, partial [Acidimicrobiia bacterium]
MAAVAAGPVVLAGTAGARRLAFRRNQRRAAEKNARLAGHHYVDPVAPGLGRAVAELTPEQLAFQRYFLDRALQPVDTFDGFEFFDQFREAALRYQLSYAQWSLALSHYRYAPAFSGYLAEAQRRLIEKMTDRRVWQYWRWENMWGNFRLDPDPIRRDNIMLSGYYGVSLATHQDLTGDRRYDEPGSLPFRWNARRVFAYDAPAIAQAVAGNMSRSSYGLYPCEPNWVYSICNTIGMAGLAAYDRLHGTSLSEPLLPRFRDSFEHEFSQVDGRPVTIRASRAGISVPGLAASTANEAGVVFWLSPSLHDVAWRSWLICREHVAGRDGPGSPGPVFQSPVDRIDLGNYRLTWGPLTYALGLAAAREMGDGEVCGRLEAGLAATAPPTTTGGVLEYPATVTSNLMMGPGVFGGERAWHDLLAYGTPGERHTWPQLAEASYPDVLVARAVSDSQSIHLVLYPGSRPGPCTLGFSRLGPHRRYVVKQAGESFVSGPDGRASI